MTYSIYLTFTNKDTSNIWVYGGLLRVRLLPIFDWSITVELYCYINLSANLSCPCALVHLDVMLHGKLKMASAESLPSHEFLTESASCHSHEDGFLHRSAVIPSLPLSIKWLRDCARENPSLRIQVRIHYMFVCTITFQVNTLWRGFRSDNFVYPWFVCQTLCVCVCVGGDEVC